MRYDRSVQALMNKKTIILFVTLFIYVVLAFLMSRPVQNKIDFEAGILDETMINTLFENSKDYLDGTEISIGIIVGDDVEYLGLRKSHNKIIKVQNKDKIFEIGSISKTFLTTLLTICLKDRSLSLTDSVRTHLPIELSQYGKDNEELRIIHLANHSSGIQALPENLIADYEYEPSGKDEIKIVSEYLKAHCSYKFRPGSAYEYSNLGMALLGMIVCDKLGSDYESLLEKYISEPLGMTNTVINLTQEQKNNMYGLHPYSDSHEKTYEIDAEYDVALGWHYSKIHRERVYYHHGGTRDCSSGIAFEKDNDVGIVVLSNVSALFKDCPDITKLMYDLFGQMERKRAKASV